MAEEASTAKNPLETSEKLEEIDENLPETIKIIEKLNESRNITNNCESTPKLSLETKSIDGIDENNATSVQKPRKTYENRKNNSESATVTTKVVETTSPEQPTTSSPQQNTSRYGRARKPKITEDFYNIEDIFGPYDRIPSASPRKKSHKLELSPIKNKDSVNLQEIKSIDLNSVLSINIPEDSSIEVSKVMKIVSNNSEFSPKSPSYSSKSVKVYKNKNKSKNNDYLDEYDLEFLNGVTHDETSDSSEDETIESVNKSAERLKTSEDVNKKDRLISDSSFNNRNESHTKRTKSKALRPKKKLPSSEIVKEIKNKFESSDESVKNDDYSGNSTDSSTIDFKNNKKLNKLQKHLNIGELKSGRLRSSIAESEVEIIEVKKEIIPEIKPKNHVVITIDDTDENQEPNIYLPEVGDLSWARVGSYPFWPSIVTVEPGTSRHFKSVIFGRKNCKCYHVHFFGDNGRRSWVLATHIFPFNRRSDLETMAQSVSKDSKPKDPKHLSAFIINPNKLKKWETAVTEAESITDNPPEIRIQKFFELVSPKKKGKKRPFPSPKSKELPHKKIKLEKKSKYIKKIKLAKNFKAKRLLPNKELKSDFKIKVEDKSPSPSIKEEPLEDKIPKTKVKNHKIRKIPKLPKTADDSKSDDSLSELSDITLIKQEIRDTPSPQPQISLLQRHKRVNLFRGITKERVCQICGKNKNVYKCKGNCFGLYHIECDKKIRQRVLLKKIEEKSISSDESDSTTGTVNSKDSSNDSNVKIVSSIMDEIFQNVFKAVDQSNSSILPEITEGQSSKLDDETNKKNETPPVLSLAEQIDLKMQEVMQNLITETKYTDSTTDEGSENDETESIVIDPFQSKSTALELSQSESSKSEEYSHLPSFDDDVKKVSRKVIKHVTADGIFDVIEEEEINDYSSFKCAYCYTGIVPPCFICNKDFSKSGDDKRHKCITPQCGKYFHSECLKDWPQTKWNVSSKSKKIENETLSCPYHNCHTCISDDPRGPLSRYMNEKLSKCIRCPTTYHSTNYCIPAGTEILSTYQIICPKHLQGQPEEEDLSNSTKKLGSIDFPKKPPGKVGAIDGNKKPGLKKVMQHVNASWCFICSMGGSLICCETCPSSFHVECLKLVPPEGRYLCEECESGRLPLYDEIVWVKLGAYRWWPAQILYPADIPPNVASISHTVGEFVVRFFGSHDHYWVNRGRVFLFQEGDTGHASSKKSAVDGLFVKAIQEATRAHKKFVEERANRAAEARNGMKPPSYIKIRVNRPVGNVRSSDADTSNTTPCDCDPNWDQPCGPDSDCLNRILLTECNPMVCAAGTRCCNQCFEKRLYSPVAPFKTTGRGWGLKTLAPVTKGSFVIEYVGEVIDEKEYQRRMKRKHEQKDENYYFLTIDKDRMIDAGPKGNVARFMNHSCSPNCETQKWTINGDTRVGLFAITDIPSGAELTFNYNLECIGEEKKECRCGAPNCSGFIGVKAKQDEVPKKQKRKSLPLKHKKKKSLPAPEIKLTEVITCFICGEPDAIQPCDRDACNKYYHLNCVSLEYFQEGKWLCPWHSCTVCTKRTTRCCYMCVKSYCPLHSEGNIRYDRVKGFVCTEHDSRLRKIKRKTKKSKIKEEDDSKEAEVTPEDKDTLKTKDTLKIKKSKKQMNSYQSDIRSSMESSEKTNEEMAEKEEIEVEDSDKPKKLKNPPENNPEITEEAESSSSQSHDEGNEKKPKTASRKSSRSSTKTEETDENEDLETAKLFNETKNGVIIKTLKQNEESGNSSSDMLQIDIFVASETNTTIKKRKSRLSLKQPQESSNSASNSSQDDLSEDEPLVKLKKIKLSEETSPDPQKIEETTKVKSKKKSEAEADLDLINADLHSSKVKKTKTDFDSSGTSEADFVASPKKVVKKPKKTTSDLQTKTKKLRTGEEKKTSKIKKQKILKKTNHNLKKLSKLQTKKYGTKYSQSVPSTSKTKIPKKFNLSLRKIDPSTKNPPKPKNKIRKPNLALYKKGMRRSIRNLKQYRDMKFSGDEDSSSDEKTDKNKTSETISSSNDDLNTTNAEIKSNIAVIKKKKKMSNDDLPTNNEEIKSNIVLKKKKKKKLSLSLRKSLRGSKTDDSLDESSLPVKIEAPNLQIELPDQPKKEKNVMKVKKLKKLKNLKQLKRKRGRPRNDEKTPETTENPPQIQDEEIAEGEMLKKKRGRPRKTPIPPPENDNTDSEAPLTPVPVVKRPIGRPRKQKIVPEIPTAENKQLEPVNQVTELYKMKISEAIPKNPFDNHVNEVKLTANVPERHLRVVLRKHSEIDTKIDNKFLKMQNDIERDLPIRKRSKLRYEAQL